MTGREKSTQSRKNLSQLDQERVSLGEVQQALLKGHWTKFEEYLDRDPELINRKFKSGLTILHAVIGNYMNPGSNPEEIEILDKAVSVLLEHDIDIDAVTRTDCKLKFDHTQYGGTKIDIVDLSYEKITLWQWAAVCGRKDIAERMVSSCRVITKQEQQEMDRLYRIFIGDHKIVISNFIDFVDRVQSERKRIKRENAARARETKLSESSSGKSYSGGLGNELKYGGEE